MTFTGEEVLRIVLGIPLALALGGGSCGGLASPPPPEVCAPAFEDCDRDAANGCETNITSSPNNCHGCGRVCTAGQLCVDAVCEWPDAGDASAPDVDDAPADPLSPCMDGRDVFYVDVEGANMPGANGQRTFTNLGAIWTVELQPLEVNVMGPGIGEGLDIFTSGQIPVPGTYPQPIPQPPAGVGPWLELSLYQEVCISPAGSFTLVNLQTSSVDGGMPQLAALLVSFDVTCKDGTRARGCVRYTE